MYCNHLLLRQGAWSCKRHTFWELCGEFEPEPVEAPHLLPLSANTVGAGVMWLLLPGDDAHGVHGPEERYMLAKDFG